MKKTILEGKQINNPKKNKIPNHICKAYGQWVTAEDNYSKALKLFAPKPPIKVGEKVYVKHQSWSLFKPCVVRSVSYDPYTGKSFGGWRICFTPMNKDFSNPHRTRYWIWANEETQIKSVINSNQ